MSQSRVDQGRLLRGDQVNAIVHADRGAILECIGDSDCKSWVHELVDFIEGHPADLSCFIRALDRVAVGGASKDQGHDAAAEVLVDASESVYSNRHASLFNDFPAYAVFERLAKLEHSPGCFPMPVVLPSDGEHAVTLVNDHTSDAHRVLRHAAHQRHRPSC
jgi:hypothetical protein